MQLWRSRLVCGNGRGTEQRPRQFQGIWKSPRTILGAGSYVLVIHELGLDGTLFFHTLRILTPQNWLFCTAAIWFKPIRWRVQWFLGYKDDWIMLVLNDTVGSILALAIHIAILWLFGIWFEVILLNPFLPCGIHHHYWELYRNIYFEDTIFFQSELVRRRRELRS